MDAAIIAWTVNMAGYININFERPNARINHSRA